MFTSPFKKHSQPDAEHLMRGPFYRCVQWTSAALAASLFLSTAATNIFAGILGLLALWVWYEERPSYLLRDPLSIACLTFLAWLALREWLATGSLELTFDQLNDFRPLLLLIVFAPLFVDKNTANFAIRGFLLTATGFALISLIAWAAFDIRSGTGKASNLYGIPIILASLGYLQAAWNRSQQRRWLTIAALICVAALLFASQRRTGYLLFVFSLLSLLWCNVQGALWRRLLVVMLGGVLVSLLVFSSATVRDRLGKATNEIQHYYSLPTEQRGTVQSNSGERLRYWTAGIQVVQINPLFGVGLSEFPQHYMNFAKQAGAKDQRGSHNPHNEYLFVLAGLGLIGLALLLNIYRVLISNAVHHPSANQRHLFMIGLIALMISTTFNSMLIDMSEGHFFLLMVLVFYRFSGPAHQHRLDRRQDTLTLK